MTTVYEIPLIASPQAFSVTLAGVSYNMQLMFHEAHADKSYALSGADLNLPGSVENDNILDSWTLDIYDANNNPIVCGLPLIPGIDLLYQHGYLGIGGALGVVVDGDPSGVPSFVGLGTTGHVYFVTEP